MTKIDTFFRFPYEDPGKRRKVAVLLRLLVCFSYVFWYLKKIDQKEVEKKSAKKKRGKSIFVKRGEPKFPPSSGRRCCCFSPKLAGKRGGEKRVKIP